MRKLKPFQYRKIKKPAPIPTPEAYPPVEELSPISGTIDGERASMAEVNILKAAYNTGTIASHTFRMPVGAPKYMPGWKELDFLLTAKSGNMIGLQVKDYEFVHHGMASTALDNASDAMMIQALAKEGVHLQGNKIYSIDANDCATVQEASMALREILI